MPGLRLVRISPPQTSAFPGRGRKTRGRWRGMAWLRRGAAAGLTAWTEAKPTSGLMADAPPDSSDWNDFWEPTGGIQHATQGLPRCPRLQNLVRRGVPPDQRAALWRLCAAPGNPGHYDALLEQQQALPAPALALPRTRPPGSRPTALATQFADCQACAALRRRVHRRRPARSTRICTARLAACLRSGCRSRRRWPHCATCSRHVRRVPAPPRPAHPARLEAAASSSRVAPRVQTRPTTPRWVTVSR